LTSSVVLTLGLFYASAAAHAQDVPPGAPQLPGAPLPAPPPFPAASLPLGPAPQTDPAGPQAPHGSTSPSPLPAKSWYGWQILIPTAAADALVLTSLYAGQGSSAAAGFTLAGLIGRGLSGPIVHLAHHRPLTALASFGLEAALPALVLTAAFTASCHDQNVCAGELFAFVVGLPIALTVGPAIDSTALAWEDRPASSDKAAGVTFSVAPLVLPSPRPGTAHAPAPTGIALVGTF